jgi:hypothetical protein
MAGATIGTGTVEALCLERRPGATDTDRPGFTTGSAGTALASGGCLFSPRSSSAFR